MNSASVSAIARPIQAAVQRVSGSRPDALDRTMLALTACLWSGYWVLVTALMFLPPVRPGVAAAVAASGVTSVAGMLACAAVHALLRRSTGVRPGTLLLRAVVLSVPTSIALALVCRLMTGLPVDSIIWHSLDYLWVLFTWSALLVGATVLFEVRQRDLQLAAMREAAQQAQLLALRAQVNPHFLLNAFNTLAGLIALDRQDASERIVLDLSHFLRHTLTHTPAESVALAEEIGMLRRYLEIEKARFGDRLRVGYDIPPGCERALVPALMLLPLAENSIKYAMGAAEDGIAMRVGARREGDALLLWLEDERRGPGASAANGPGLGIGLSNLRQQLAGMYGGRATLEAGPTGRGWRNHLRIPWQEAPA